MGIKRAIYLFSACAVSALLILSFMLPLARPAGKASERYCCTWEDGTVTDENYASAYSALSACTSTDIILEKNGKNGKIALGDEAREAVSVLESGALADLLRVSGSGFNRLETAAIYRRTEETVFYDGEYFVWSGTRLLRTEERTAKKLVLLSGELPASDLCATGAEELEIRADADFTASALIGSQIRRATAHFPYSVSGEAIYRQTAGGKRLIAGLPCAEAIAVDGDTDFADSEALAPCAFLKELTLPFIGSCKNTATEQVGELGYLFGRDEAGAYLLPQTLKKITVGGGILLAHAFYRCTEIAEIIVCGMAAEDISRTAFADCTSWQAVHCPRGDLLLPGERYTERLSCGCLQYIRCD